MDNRGLDAIRARFLVGKLTDEKLNALGSRPGPPVQPRVLPRIFGGRGRRTDLARSLRKQTSERSNAMIAATAFAVVGLVVVAFLNRIP